jgi:nitrite reductase/ring-hydroxylating ferredoxin subunit
VRYQPLEKLINLHDGYRRQFKIDHLQLLLVQEHGELFLIEANCPHSGHALQSATFAHDTVRCALHQYEFSLRDGRLLQATEEPCRALRVFNAVYAGNEIGVMLDD